MGVIQISKIQQRRGRKLSDVGIPQLSAAEFAWAVDTQELFIGNGSIADGAPYVGNTKIITEHDNILQLATGYTFAEPDPSIAGSISRSLQGKLDETVSVLDFGAVPDGSTDCTPAFHRAFDTLYKNVDDKYKKVLLIPNGKYLFFSTLKIPSRAILMGETQSETILEIGNNPIVFVSSSGTESGFFSSSDLPTGIKIINLTINHDLGQTEINSCQNCVFEKVKWSSNYVLGDEGLIEENAHGVFNIPIVSQGGRIEVSGSGVSTTITQIFNTTYSITLNSLVSLLTGDSVFNRNFSASVFGTSLKITAKDPSALVATVQNSFTIGSQSSGEAGQIFSTVPAEYAEYSDGSENVSASVYWRNVLFGIRATKIKFIDCEFVSTKLAVECQHSKDPVADFSTEVDFQGCKFFECETGIYFGGIAEQDVNWKIVDCHFEQISKNAVLSTNGRGIHISRTRFQDCGIGTNSSGYPITSAVKFNEPFNNVVFDCSSNRHQSSAVVISPTVTGVVEFENASIASLVDRNYARIDKSDSPRVCAVFPASNRFIIIDYFLTLGSTIRGQHSRLGKLVITIGDDISGTEESNGTFGPFPGNISDVSISDSYQYSPETSSSTGGALMTDFEFSVDLRDNDEDSGIETVVLNYVNPVATGDTGTLSYSITYGV